MTTHLDNNQVRFVARQVEDPSKIGDMLLVGFGDIGGGIIDDELAEEVLRHLLIENTYPSMVLYRA